MSIQRSRSPFERLRQRLDRTSARCRECGYDGDDAGWHVTTSGRSIHYRFVCPSCAASRRGGQARDTAPVSSALMRK
ncbi:HVO_0649 family zinc finger protein [Saliphagus sp. GCM10025308]